jgi:hypothetical protein
VKNIWIKHDFCNYKQAILRKMVSGKPMEKLSSFEFSALVDMLASYTANYTKMRAEGCTDKQFASCSLAIKVLQAEIATRKQTAANSSISKRDISFTTENPINT